MDFRLTAITTRCVLCHAYSIMYIHTQRLIMNMYVNVLVVAAFVCNEQQLSFISPKHRHRRVITNSALLLTTLTSFKWCMHNITKTDITVWWDCDSDDGWWWWCGDVRLYPTHIWYRVVISSVVMFLYEIVRIYRLMVI